MALVQEGYTATFMAADSNNTFAGINGIGGFLAKTAGTVTVTDDGVTIVSAHPVAAGGYYAMPFATHGSVVVTLAGGASGTIGTHG
jgi:hypothetical protein